MNQTDRKNFEVLGEKIDMLAKGLKTLEYLGDEKTVEALEDLVRIAPTLKQLAKGYEMAGIGGNFIKWIAGVATALVALIAVIRLYMGDAK